MHSYAGAAGEGAWRLEKTDDRREKVFVQSKLSSDVHGITGAQFGLEMHHRRRTHGHLGLFLAPPVHSS